jgi:hypothetical protein
MVMDHSDNTIGLSSMADRQLLSSNAKLDELIPASTLLKPGVSFALGTALVVVAILVVTVVGLCFYHWAQLLKAAVAHQETAPDIVPATSGDAHHLKSFSSIDLVSSHPSHFPLLIRFITYKTSTHFNNRISSHA